MSTNPLVKITRIDTRGDDIEQKLHELREKLSPRGDIVSEAGRRLTVEVFGEALSPGQVVERICTEVRDQGVEAILRYSKSLDRADLTAETLRVPLEDMADAHKKADVKLLDAVRRVRDNIMEFQTAILHKETTVTRPGVSLTQRYLPIRRAGLCVPGGAAAYPSTVLMTAVPAQAAGVKEFAVVTPPTAFGAYNVDLLATCHELGVDEVYRIGGAQGVATLAYGTKDIPPVDMIVGPGNLFVALAKRYVYGEVNIDSIAGPSEVVVIVDETTRPDFTATDILAQAEHAPGASILITWSEAAAEATLEQLAQQTATLSRGELAAQSLEAFGAVILVRDEDEACRISDMIAPEHLHVAVDRPERLLDRLNNAGAIFLGHYTPVAVGDYAAGPSHVLPTSGTARWASGLSSNDFLRSGSVISYTAEALKNIATEIETIATCEGLTAHRDSVTRRVR